MRLVKPDLSFLVNSGKEFPHIDRNILGLELEDHCLGPQITDKYVRLFRSILDDIVRPVGSGVEISGSAMEAGERRVDMTYSGAKQDYLRVLKSLAVHDKFFYRALNYRNKERLGFSDRLTDLIKIVSWVLMGNDIPSGEVNETKAKDFIKQNGYEFRRITGGLGWYLDGSFVAKDYHSVLSNMSVDMWELV